LFEIYNLLLCTINNININSKQIKMKIFNSSNAKRIIFSFFSLLLMQTICAIPAPKFTEGNLVVFQTASSAVTSNTSGAFLEISSITANQVSAVNTFNIAKTTLRFSGSATSTGYLANSNDGTLVFVTGGYNSNDDAVNVNTITSRGVGSLDNAFNFNIATSYTGTSGQQTRCATSLDNSTFFIGDQSGLFTNTTTSASPSGNIRSVKAFGGVVYAFASSTSSVPVSVVSAPTGGALTALPGLGMGVSSHQDFYMVSSGSNGSTYDILYILSATSATAGTIAKYSLVSGSWVANGTYTTNFGGFGLCATYASSNTALYITTGTGATSTNKVMKLLDVAGYNTTIDITTANNITLFTTLTGTILKGIAFAPKTADISTTAPQTTTRLDIYKEGNSLVFNASAGEVIDVYQLLGKKLIHQTATEGKNIVPVSETGFVVVRVGNRTACIEL